MATQVTINDPAKAKEYFEAKMAFTTGPVELERMMKNNEVNVVDVRAAEDYAEGHIPGAINLPKDQWQTLKGLRKDKTNVLYCYSQVCHLAATAAVEFAGERLSRHGIGRRMALVARRRLHGRKVTKKGEKKGRCLWTTDKPQTARCSRTSRNSSKKSTACSRRGLTDRPKARTCSGSPRCRSSWTNVGIFCGNVGHFVDPA